MENNKGSQMDRINRYADLIYKHPAKLCARTAQTAT